MSLLDEMKDSFGTETRKAYLKKELSKLDYHRMAECSLKENDMIFDPIRMISGCILLEDGVDYDEDQLAHKMRYIKDLEGQRAHLEDEASSFANAERMIRIKMWDLVPKREEFRFRDMLGGRK